MGELKIYKPLEPLIKIKSIGLSHGYAVNYILTGILFIIINLMK